MVTVAEGDAFENAAGQVRPGMAHAHAKEAGLRVRMYVGCHQERQEQRHEFRRGDLLHPAVHEVVDAAARGFLFFLQFRKQFPDEPLEIARGGRGGLLDEIVARESKAGIHLHSSVHHRFPADVFVDGPGPRDHAHLGGIRDARRDGAGVDVEHASDDRRSRLQAALRRCLLCHVPADLRGPAEGRKRILHFGNAVHIQKPIVEIHRPEIHKAGAGIIRDLRLRFSCQTETDIILALEHPADIRIILRLVVPEPGEKGRGLAGHDVLKRAVECHFLHSVGLPLHRIPVCPVVCGNDAVPRRFPVLTPKIQSFSMSGNADAGHIRRIDACLFQGPLKDRAVRVPHFLHIALNETGLRGDRLRGDAAGAQFSALFVKNCCLGGGSAIVESDVITHTFSLLSVVDKHQVRCRFSVQLTVFSLYHMIVPEMTDFRPVSA